MDRRRHRPGLDLTRGALVTGVVLTIIYAVSGFVVESRVATSGGGALARVVLTAAAALTLCFGPGLALRRWLPGASVWRNLALLPLPGLVALAVTGTIAWWLAPGVTARTTSLVLLAPVVGVVAVAAARDGAVALTSGSERRALAVLLVLLVVVLGKEVWSRGPEGELYRGTVSRTLEVGDRSDARIPFHVVQLVAHGRSPYSPIGRAYFAPYSFSHRGPVAGLAAAPVVVLSGAKPPVGRPDNPWKPYDARGFAAYRIAMSVFALAALTSMFGIVCRLRGPVAGLVATGATALTPFVVHETYFTWPKLLSAALVVSAAYLVMARQPLVSGLVLGLAYLVHPLALLAAPAVGLVYLLFERHRSRRVLAGGVALVLAAGTLTVGWRVVNGDEYRQDDFVDYLDDVAGREADGPADWAEGRLQSVANTLVPLHLPAFYRDHPSVNAVGTTSAAVIRYFFSYWNTFPFAVGIMLFPLLVCDLAKSARRAPWAFTAVVVVPFVLFTLYWGSYETGMMREGLQAWLLGVIAFSFWARPLWRPGSHLARPHLYAVCFSARAAEVLALLILPTVRTDGLLGPGEFRVTDVAAVVAMVGGLAGLAVYVYRITAASPAALFGGGASAPAEPSAAPALTGRGAGAAGRPVP